MIVQSGAVAAYIDRKALNREELKNLTALLRQIPVLRLSESEIMAIGHLSWETYQAVRAMAEQVCANARCYVHDLHGEGTPCMCPD